MTLAVLIGLLRLLAFTPLRCKSGNESDIPSRAISAFSMVLLSFYFICVGQSDGYIKPRAHLIISLIIFLVEALLLICVYPRAQYHDENHQKERKKAFVLWLWRLGCLLSFFGCTLMARYFHNLEKTLEYNYHGPMRIMDTEIQRDSFLVGCSDYGCTYHEGYRAKFVVEWGDEWACPGPFDDKWCKTRPEYSDCSRVICGRRSCSNNERESARHQVLQCLWNVHANTTLITDGYYNFTREQPPWEDAGWPAATFYGNCGECAAKDSISYETFTSLYDYGIVMLVVGASIALITCLPLLGCSPKTSCHYSRAAKNRMDETEESSVDP